MPKEWNVSMYQLLGMELTADLVPLVTLTTETSVQVFQSPPVMIFMTEGCGLADIDECAVESPCQHICTNTDGSYECSCNHGYVVNISDPTECLGESPTTFISFPNLSLSLPPSLSPSLPLPPSPSLSLPPSPSLPLPPSLSPSLSLPPPSLSLPPLSLPPSPSLPLSLPLPPSPSLSLSLSLSLPPSLSLSLSPSLSLPPSLPPSPSLPLSLCQTIMSVVLCWKIVNSSVPTLTAPSRVAAIPAS